MRYTAVVLLALSGAPLAFGDASYQETTEITGGSIVTALKMASVFSSRAKQAQAPTTSSVMIRGNRMVRSSPLSTEIIDLDQQTITHIDTQKKQYYVTTFAQMQEAMQRASEEVKQKKQEAASESDSAKISFSAKVRETGATKQVDGQNAKEAVLTMTMDATSITDADKKGSIAITSDMWLIADAPGYDEVKSFNLRMAKALAMDTEMSSMAALLNSQPGAGKAMADMKNEMAKMSGIPVLQVMRMGMTANGEPLPAPSQQTAQTTSTNSDKAAESNRSAENNSAENNGVASSLGGMLGGGGFGSLMRHRSKKNAQNSESSNDAGAQNASAQNANTQTGGAEQSAVLLEMSMHRSNFSAGAVDAANFEVPAGFKQMESPMNRNR